jgi:hypothetical protein
MFWEILWAPILGFFLSAVVQAAPPHCGGHHRPLVAIIGFVCTIGNVPLVAVLWNGGISSGGVIACIFAT